MKYFNSAMRHISLMLSAFIWVGVCLSTCVSASDNGKAKERQSLKNVFEGREFALQVEASSGTELDGLPNKGVYLVHFHDDNRYDSALIGNGAMVVSSGEFALKKLRGQVVAYSYDASRAEEIETHYYFETPHSGIWQRTVIGQDAQLSGSFSAYAADDVDFTPDNHIGRTIALGVITSESDIPKEYYPSQGLIMQAYDGYGRYTALGFGPGAVDHSGTYTLTKVAKNIFVEETIQVMENLTAPYTLVYHYETPSSGRWFQNFGDGLILFSGSFTSFETP